MPEFLFRKEVVPGIIVHTLATGGDMMLCYVTLCKGARLPEHSHPHHQSSFVVSGHLRFSVDGVVHDRRSGEGIVFAPNVPHGAEVIEDSIVSDVFVPVRKEYLP